MGIYQVLDRFHLGRKCVMTKLDKLEQIIKIVKAQEEIGLAKAKSVIEEVKSYDIPDKLEVI